MIFKTFCLGIQKRKLRNSRTSFFGIGLSGLFQDVSRAEKLYTTVISNGWFEEIQPV